MCKYAKEQHQNETLESLTNDGFFGQYSKYNLLFHPILKKSQLKYWQINTGRLRNILDQILFSRPSVGATPAGYTYLGQFITHEIVPDSNRLRGHTAPRVCASPYFNLDSLYFSDCLLTNNPDLMDDGKFHLKKITRLKERDCFDFNRTKSGTAITPEPRNDDNLIVAQLTVKIQEFHNFIFDSLKKGNKSKKYARVKAFVTLLLQRIVVEDYLQKILHPRVYELYFIKDMDAFAAKSFPSFSIPLEYSHAAFRFGHSMVRPSYDLSGCGRGTELKDLFNPGETISAEKAINWRKFFPIDETEKCQCAMKIDLKIADTFTGAFQAVDTKEYSEKFSDSAITDYYKALKNIAFNDIAASQAVPSPENIVERMRRANMHDISVVYRDLRLPDPRQYFRLVEFTKEFKQKVGIDEDFSIQNCPLWLFFLRESEIYPINEATTLKATTPDYSGRRQVELPNCDAQRLGPIASVVVAETLKNSIKGAGLNIFQSWDSISRRLGDELKKRYQSILVSHKYLHFEHLITYIEQH